MSGIIVISSYSVCIAVTGVQHHDLVPDIITKQTFDFANRLTRII